MAQTKRMAAKSVTMGDAAVDGLLGGLGAGVVMAIVLVALGLISGEGPAIVLGRLDASGKGLASTGALMHLAVAGVYGAVFGIGWKLIARGRLPGWLAGVAFGLALLVLAEAIILPSSQSPLLAMPFWQFGAAHIAYGLTLGTLVNRMRNGKDD